MPIGYELHDHEPKYAGDRHAQRVPEYGRLETEVIAKQEETNFLV